MTLDQTIREAVDSNDPALLAVAVDVMRNMGWNYEQCRDAAIQSVPGLTADRWEDMMLRIDNNDLSLT